ANGHLNVETPKGGAPCKAVALPPSHSEAEETRIRSALASIPADERDTWRDVGFALQWLSWGEIGRQIWDDWSRTCPEQFDERDEQKTWESFHRPYDGEQITSATIFYKAGQQGWVDETQSTDFHTELGNARRLVNRHGENLRFVAQWGKWIVWNNDRWE